jgi:hypothetical protein
MKRSAMVGLAAVLLCIMLAALGSNRADAAEVDRILALAEKIKNEASDIDVKLWTDKEKYQVSDKVVFGFTADKDCYLCIINIGTSGNATLLFPNKWQPSNKVEKDKEHSIPPEGSEYTFKVMGPVGTERIKVIASSEPILENVASLQKELKAPAEEASGSDMPFLILKNPQAVFKDIGIALAQSDTSKWATVDLTFTVEDASAGSSASPGQTQPK